MAIRHGCGCAAILGALLAGGLSLAQAPAPLPGDSTPTSPLIDDALVRTSADEPTTSPSPEPTLPPGDMPQLPEAPETTVVGRPAPFPAQPLSDNTVVTPTGTEALSGEIGSSLTVITSQEIVETQKTSVSDVLRTVPGLDVVQTGAPGGMTSVFLRGASSQHTKVLLDGMPMNDPSNASRSFDFSTLSVDNIERIEVLRGPQSMLYGSDAIGGVVNIITKRGEGPAKLSLGVLAGSYGTAREAMNLSGGGKNGYYSLGGSYLQSDGFSAASSGTEKDGTSLGTLSGRFGLTPSDDFDVDYVFRWVDQDAAIDDSGYGTPPTDNLIRRNLVEAFYNRLQFRRMTLDGFWEHRVGLSLVDYDRRDTDPGLYGIPHFKGETRKFDYQSNFYLSDENTFTLGVDYQDEQSEDTSDPLTSQTLAGCYLQDQLRLMDRLFLTGGVRWDDHSEAGSATTYRLTGLFRMPVTETGFHSSIGTGFRAPSLAEIPYGPSTGLKPEKSTGWDAGVEQPFFDNRLTLDGTYFHNRYTDLIQFDYSTYTLSNIGRSVSRGVETTASYKINPCVRLFGNYAYTFTEDLDTGLPLLRRPVHKASFGVSRSLWCDRATLTLYTNYVGPREDSDGVTRMTLREYWLLNTAATYNLTKHLQLVGRLDNLLNENYQEVYGYNSAGLSFYTGINGWW